MLIDVGSIKNQTKTKTKPHMICQILKNKVQYDM